MDNWLALFDGQTSYFLDINDSSVKPDVLRFYGREALSEPFRWDIEFTTLQANIPPEQVLMKYASFRMRSGKSVHGIVTRLEWLSPEMYAWFVHDLQTVDKGAAVISQDFFVIRSMEMPEA